MKKFTMLFTTAVSLMMLSFNGVQAQALSKGNFVIDPYYGFPNFGKTFSKAVAEDVDDLKPTGLGPWGLRLEYMAGDRFGITLDGIQNSFGLKYTETPDFITDADGNEVANTQEYEYSADMNRLRIQLGFNYHFDFSDENVDGYFGVAAGTNMRFWSASTTEPNLDYEEEVSGSGSLIPASFRIRFGGRYYFTNNIGLNMELGIGGPIISGGLSIKL